MDEGLWNEVAAYEDARMPDEKDVAAHKAAAEAANMEASNRRIVNVALVAQIDFKNYVRKQLVERKAQYTHFHTGYVAKIDMRGFAEFLRQYYLLPREDVLTCMGMIAPISAHNNGRGQDRKISWSGYELDLSFTSDTPSPPCDAADAAPRGSLEAKRAKRARATQAEADE